MSPAPGFGAYGWGWEESRLAEPERLVDGYFSTTPLLAISPHMTVRITLNYDTPVCRIAKHATGENYNGIECFSQLKRSQLTTDIYR